MTTGPPRSAARSGIRGRVVIAIAVALSAFAFPEVAQAHARSAVIALDYKAGPAANGAVAPGVEARVIDGDRSVELEVAAGRTVMVRGYGGEPFLRFSARGVEANLRSPTAVADKLVPERAAGEVSATSAPLWTLVTTRHRLTWHDHRLGPRAGDREGAGRVGSWTIPLAVDGKRAVLRGSLWRSSRPAPWPWVAMWLAALAAAGAVTWRAASTVRRTSVYVATVGASLVLLAVSAGFSAGSARPGFTRWADLALPAGIAAAAGALFALRPRRRYVACALVAGFVFAAALEDVSVFWHGFVISSLPAQLVRAGVALALAASAYAALVVLGDLVREKPGRRRTRPVPQPQPRLAVPKGKR